MFDGIIFDLDGTLWDSREGICESWNQGVAELIPGESAQITLENLTPCLGMLVEDIGHKLFPHVPQETMDRVMHHCCQVENEYLARVGGTLYPKLEETLAMLAKDYPLFIVSNCQRGYIECFFAAHGLQHYFKDWECPGNTGLPKADNISLVVERNCLKHPLYVGDTQGDCNSATKAGVPFLHAAYGFGQVEGGYPRVDAFGEIPGKIAIMLPLNL